MEDAITTEEFDNALEEILGGMKGDQLLLVPGIYEVVSEHFFNEVINIIINKRS